MDSKIFNLKSKLRIGTEVVVTFPPERVMSALPPVGYDAPPTQPIETRIETHVEIAEDGRGNTRDSTRRARKALFGAGV